MRLSTPRIDHISLGVISVVLRVSLVLAGAVVVSLPPSRLGTAEAKVSQVGLSRVTFSRSCLVSAKPLLFFRPVGFCGRALESTASVPERFMPGIVALHLPRGVVLVSWYGRCLGALQCLVVRLWCIVVFLGVSLRLIVD